MANVRLVFSSSSSTENYDPELECFLNARNEITVKIVDVNNEDDYQVMTFDKSTAIKLAKTLRTEINKIEEVSND